VARNNTVATQQDEVAPIVLETRSFDATGSEVARGDWAVACMCLGVASSIWPSRALAVFTCVFLGIVIEWRWLGRQLGRIWIELLASIRARRGETLDPRDISSARAGELSRARARGEQ
jgi:hypothetical protein